MEELKEAKVFLEALIRILQCSFISKEDEASCNINVMLNEIGPATSNNPETRQFELEVKVHGLEILSLVDLIALDRGDLREACCKYGQAYETKLCIEMEHLVMEEGLFKGLSERFQCNEAGSCKLITTTNPTLQTTEFGDRVTFTLFCQVSHGDWLSRRIKQYLMSLYNMFNQFTNVSFTYAPKNEHSKIGWHLWENPTSGGLITDAEFYFNKDEAVDENQPLNFAFSGQETCLESPYQLTATSAVATIKSRVKERVLVHFCGPFGVPCQRDLANTSNLKISDVLSLKHFGFDLVESSVSHEATNHDALEPFCWQNIRWKRPLQAGLSLLLVVNLDCISPLSDLGDKMRCLTWTRANIGGIIRGSRVAMHEASAQAWDQLFPDKKQQERENAFQVASSSSVEAIADVVRFSCNALFRQTCYDLLRCSSPAGVEKKVYESLTFSGRRDEAADTSGAQGDHEDEWNLMEDSFNASL